MARIDFVAEEEQCPSCSGTLRVRRSSTRTVVSLAEGKFEAREVVKTCVDGDHCPEVRSSALAALVKSRQRYAYDLIVHVGVSRYIGGKQRDEIRDELEQRGIELSAGTITNLCDRFLLLLERLHLHRAPALRAAMGEGYPLHLDATCEHGRGGLFLTMSGWKGWVLVAARIQTENQDALRPIVEKTVRLFGTPIAMVHDMGEGIMASVDFLRQQGVPDFVCHYHFLAAVGRKLFDDAYRSLRETLRVFGTRSALRVTLRQLRRDRADESNDGDSGKAKVRQELLALVLWMLEGSGRKDQLYPFSLVHFEFFERCTKASERIERWVPNPRTGPERRAIRHILNLTKRLQGDPRLDRATELLSERWQAFCELRDVLRLGSDELPRGGRGRQQGEMPEMELVRLHQIEQALIAYRTDLLERIAVEDHGPRKNSTPSIILGYLQLYGSQLFGHPVRRDPNGRLLDVVDRTNNRLECRFGDDKQKLRRRVGRAHLGRDLQQQPAQASLAPNLLHNDYVQALCGSIDNMPTAFAEIEGLHIEDATPLKRDHRDTKLQRLVRQLLSEGLELDTESASIHDESLPHQTFDPAELDERSETELRSRCTEVFKRESRKGKSAQVPSSQSPSASSAMPVKTPKTSPMGKLHELMARDLDSAGYSPSSCKVFLVYARQLSTFHKRSPRNMGREQVTSFMLHLVEKKNVSLSTYRNARTSLQFLYRITLNRPEEVEHLPLNPWELRRIATEMESHTATRG